MLITSPYNLLSNKLLSFKLILYVVKILVQDHVYIPDGKSYNLFKMIKDTYLAVKRCQTNGFKIMFVGSNVIKKGKGGSLEIL